MYGPLMAEPGNSNARGQGRIGAAWENLETLIRRAFLLAKDSGKEDWHLMYAGVLKNRLLTLTDGQFDEGDWGAATFTSLIESLPQLLRVDRGVRPPMVELLEPDGLEAAPTEVLPSIPTRAAEERVTEAGRSSDSRRWRIRKDLWDAVLGVRDPSVFIWDGQMVTRVPQEQAHDEDRRLPTLTGPDLDAWQSEFAQEQAPDPAYASILESWAHGATPTAKLPRQLQHLWYARLKALVRSRLESWFDEKGITPPADMIEVPSSPRARPGDTAAELRELVVACVQVMTEAELRGALGGGQSRANGSKVPSSSWSLKTHTICTSGPIVGACSS